MDSNELTWELLVESEPRLGLLLEEIQHTSPRWIEEHGFDNAWALTFKPKLRALVGWEMREPAKPMILIGAYDIAYRRLYDALVLQAEAAQERTQRR